MHVGGREPNYAREIKPHRRGMAIERSNTSQAPNEMVGCLHPAVSAIHITLQQG